MNKPVLYDKIPPTNIFWLIFSSYFYTQYPLLEDSLESNERMAEDNWFKSHWKQVITHTLILSGILFFCVFSMGPIFNSAEGNPGESQLQQVLLPAETNNVKYNIDQLVIDADRINIVGWAFIDGFNSNDNVVYVVLISNNRTYVFNTNNYRRPDVTIFFKHTNFNLDKSGFTALIPANMIDSGIYKIGIYIEKGDVKALAYTDKMVIKSGDSLKLTVQ